MTDDESRTEFQTHVAAVASDVVSKLMKDDILGPFDSAFALGSAAKLIAGVVHKSHNIPLDECESEVRKAFIRGFEVTQAQIILLKDQH